MTDQIVTEWLTEWNEVKDTEREKVSKFAESILSNEDLFQAITHVMEETDRFKSQYNEIIATLFKLFRTSSQKKLQLFTIQFIPALIYVYLDQVHSQKRCVALETLLRGILELESASEDHVPRSTRIPNIHLPSIFHDPGGVSTSWISEGELDRLSARTVKVVNRPTLVFTEERIRAPQRLPLCTELWWIFNHRLPDLHKHPIPSYLKTVSLLITQGFSNSSSHRTHSTTRIILSSKLLIEMVHTVYFSIYNGEPTRGEQVLEEARNRANYQLWADAILVCNALENYLKSSEIPVQVEPSTFKKTIITNASFRTKKLPEDIPIVESEASNDEAGGGGDTPSNNLITKSKSKLPHLLSKMKRNSLVAMNEEGEVETMAILTTPTPPGRKKSIDSTPV